jgi:hypothetical protein
MSRLGKKTTLGLTQIFESIPKSFDFEYCAVSSTTTRSFVINNLTSGIMKFTIKKPENSPFEVSLLSGVLQVKGKQEITLSYTPKECEVIIASIIINLNGEEEKVVKLSAVSKHPLLSVSDTSLDFEELLVGKSEEKQVLVHNIGQVPTLFKIEKAKSEDEDTSFNVTPKKGLIPPGESYSLTFRYKPRLVGVCSNAHFTVKSKGGNKIDVSAFGVGTGYDVHLSAKSMNFGETSFGNNITRLINVVNNSDLATSFQFLVDSKNLFSFSVTEGVVKARNSVRVIISFNPLATGNYYERVF